MTISKKVETYLTMIDRTLTIAGSSLIALETVYGQAPWIGLGVAGVGIGLSMVKYAEKIESDPATADLVSEVESRVSAIEDSLKPKPTPSPAPTP